jgi:DNA-binding GntR family transcriptional regulator
LSKIHNDRENGKMMEKNHGSVGREDEIYSDIVAAISEQRLPPGTQLKEDELNAIYGVGRTAIRAVLSRLAHDEIAVRISNRGAFVAKPTAEEAREVFSARRLIEGSLVKQLANQMDKKLGKTLRSQIEREAGARMANDFTDVLRESGNFHMVLARAAGINIIYGYLNELLTKTALISILYQRRNSAECELDEHRRLADSIIAGHADEAEKLMIAHLDGILARMDLSASREPQSNLHNVLGRN